MLRVFDEIDSQALSRNHYFVHAQFVGLVRYFGVVLPELYLLDDVLDAPADVLALPAALRHFL